jgi:hypothetical protein
VEGRYGIASRRDVLRASFIAEGQYELWVDSTPQECPRQYLSNNGQDAYQKSRVALLQAIVCRVLAMYKHWYEELRIKDVLGG